MSKTKKTKTFRTHDGRRGNRVAIKAYVDENGRLFAASVSGSYSPDSMGASQVEWMMRKLGDRVHRWADDQGASVETDGRDVLSGEWS